jgi:2-keto-myo-inositol isomerase
MRGIINHNERIFILTNTEAAMIIGWNGETMPAVPLDRELDILGEVGYGGVEIFTPKLDVFLEQHPVADLRRRLQERKLAPLTMNCIENFSFRTPEEFERLKAECHRLSAISQEIGCRTIVIVPSPRPEGNLTWDEIKAHTVSALRELADIAAPFGVGLAFEFLAPAACSVRTLSRAWEVVQAAERKNAGLVFDTYHYFVGGSSWESLDEFDIERLFIGHNNDAENLPLEQLTDGDRLLPGEGIFPLQRMLSRLHQRGYDGAYAIEVMRPAYREREPREYAQAGLEATRRVLAQAGAI